MLLRCQAFVFAFLVVIPSAASEPAVSRFSPLSPQALSISANQLVSVPARVFSGFRNQRTGDSRFARCARNDNQKGKSDDRVPASEQPTNSMPEFADTNKSSANKRQRQKNL
ncbi:hypothetical protein HDF15_001668 [Granulicella mallensis]|uniref:Uncharacterized protein n=1 Tax=Granulicella mallensis TaxID=940614 RepID=A0A7W7ZQC6_9BACT|nr:hypothetical protein [Granulicella mallensis]